MSFYTLEPHQHIPIFSFVLQHSSPSQILENNSKEIVIEMNRKKLTADDIQCAGSNIWI
jgi:hypothetical protein